MSTVASLGSLYFTRAQYLLACDDYDNEPVAFEAQMEADRQPLDIEYRALYAQMYGLDALDRLDGFGVDDEPFDDFRVE